MIEPTPRRWPSVVAGSVRSVPNFARLIGLAAALDAVDRAEDLRLVVDAFRVPVSVVGIGLPTPTIGPVAATALGLVWLLGAAALASGSPRVQRFGALGVLVGSGTALAIDQQFFSNHTWLLWSLSFLIVAGRGAVPELTARSQISIVYLFAALSKLRSPWLDGEILRRSADGALGLTVARDLSEPGLVALAIMTIVIELLLAALIWSERFRPIAVAVAVGLHGGIILVVGFQMGLVVFAVAMLAHFLLPPVTRAAPASTRRQIRFRSASTRNSGPIPRSPQPGR